MARRKFVGVDLQEAAGLGRVGPQARAHLGHDETLLAADVQGLDYGHVERFLPFLRRRSSPTRRPPICVALAGSKSWAVIFCTVAPGGRRLDRPLPHVGIKDVDDLEIGRDLQGELIQFRAADGVGQGRAGPRDAFLDPDLLLRLHAGQGGKPRGPFRLGRPIDLHRGRGADEGQDHGLVGLGPLALTPCPSPRGRGELWRAGLPWRRSADAS